MMDAHALSFDQRLFDRGIAKTDICGVAIDVDAATDRPLYSVILLTTGGNRARRVTETPDETAARRLWCLLAKSLRVPRFVADADGGFRAIDRFCGAVVGRAPQPRRGRRIALRRRHFSRRVACAADKCRAIYADEREIICYE